MGSRILGPWSVGDDFNMVLTTTERQSNRSQDLGSNTEFADAMDLAGLIDAGFSRNRFTWSNNQAYRSRVWARLDRVFCNGSWINVFSGFHIKHLPHVNSDHCPLLFLFPPIRHSLPKSFRFQRMWTLHQEYPNIIMQAWREDLSDLPLTNLMLKMRKVKIHLKEWNKSVFGNIFQQLKTVEQSIARLEEQDQASQQISQEDLLKARKHLEHLELAEEIFWKQKFRNNWLKESDRNTKYFHMSATIRSGGLVLRKFSWNLASPPQTQR
ncbi:uncharacterized protein LOC131227344 [Magnolia sinica]|uniref:uncharacterized protein LOC131227344 n=1 Tax=Magnolia sinica TaxID=86752 RepID=UPI002657FDBD|nr:uncharacterized protein LOC131227344 [Magnolia sinica]